MARCTWLAAACAPNIDTNAANNASATWTAGANDDAITAAKLDGAGEEPVYKCVFDTAMLKTEATQFTVNADGKLLYEGGLHKYGYVNEMKDKDEQVPVSSTPSNWYENGRDQAVLLSD